MSKLTPEEKQESHNSGQREGAEDRDKGPVADLVTGHSKPWANMFEDSDHYKERVNAWEKGYEEGKYGPKK